ncbi:MAG TPA: hypothetical protein VFX88_22600 [Actinomycetota bacterium]|nr:hypothetical protein [Actinomycetota bacterium]
MVTGDELKARRYAREMVAEMRWSGMTVPPLYARMASEFQDLVRSGDYAAWVAANQTSAPMARATPGAKWTAAPHAAWRGLPLPGPVPGR